MLAIRLDNLPTELKADFLFCCWRYAPDKYRPGKFKKKPIIALTGKTARTNIPDHFTQLQYALRAFNNGYYNGVGRLLQHRRDLIYAIDLDNCVGDDGVLNEYARDLCDRAGSYSEITPSNRGIRIFVQSELPTKLLKSKSVKIWNKGSHLDYPELEVQLFMRGQYVTMSGNQIVGTPKEVTFNSKFTEYLLHQNPANLKRFFPTQVRPRRASAATRRSLDGKSNQLLDLSRAEPLNTKRTDSRIKTMILNSSIFRKNWERCSDKSGKTNSQYQLDLVECAIWRYQMNVADIRYMLQRWCQKVIA